MDPIFTQQFNYPTPQMPAQGGMFGGDSKWRNALLAAVAGFMARRSPGVAGNIINGLQDAQTLKQRMAFAQQEHQQQLQDQIAVHDANRQYDIQNAPPPDIQDRIDALEKMQPGLGKTYAQNYAQNGGGMGPILTNPMTGQQMMPAARAQPQAPPADAVARLKANPGEAPQFDEIFGHGAAASVLGGQAAPPPATFP